MILFIPTAGTGVLALLMPTSTPLDTPPPSAIPVLEVIKIYGKIAGPECYGRIAPKGSSCQITGQNFESKFHLDGKNILTLDEFQQDLNEADFKWPLKPYGIDKSLTKTATVNKGAETRLFMEQLEERGLYDKRNPTGPLPTSLRPQLNAILQKEGVDAEANEKVFRALGGNDGRIATENLREKFPPDAATDYYDFIEVIGKDGIMWPR